MLAKVFLAFEKRKKTKKKKKIKNKRKKKSKNEPRQYEDGHAGVYLPF
jgi:hypothetical protein